MAIGDAAAAAGFIVLTGTEDVRDAYIETNRSRDYLATHQTGGTHTAAQITSGVLADARIPNLNASKITAGAFAIARLPGLSAGGGTFQWDGSAWVSNGRLYSAGELSTGGPLKTPWGRANAIGGWIAAGIGADGTVAIQASSRRFKKNIRTWAPDLQAILAIRIVEFVYKVAVPGPDGALMHGLIAEELDDLGLEWLVIYDDDGQPFSVHYDRLGLAVLAVVQNHEERLQALEKGGA